MKFSCVWNLVDNCNARQLVEESCDVLQDKNSFASELSKVSKDRFSDSAVPKEIMEAAGKSLSEAMAPLYGVYQNKAIILQKYCEMCPIRLKGLGYREAVKVGE